MIFQGKAWKFGANINTDVIIPAKYLNTSNPKELAKHCMEGIDKDFSTKVKINDIIIAENNFGCGSSREHAPVAIKESGVSCIIAKSFARIFYRNAFNIGLPLLESKEAVENICTGDDIKINLLNGEILNITQNKKFYAQPIPPFMVDLIKSGGLIGYIRKKLKISSSNENL
ncbi:MAG: 3-isopropylmalate dehydratase small subunit [Spirochaetes bacterium]|nr:MAG: 3-isopropylmalate dehydratase small subunit [Spirochaetota bacterium]